MKKAKIILNKILHPPLWIIIILSVTAFAGLIYVFAENNKSASAYVFYVLSAYSLVILIIDLTKRLPRLKNKIHAFIVEKSGSVKFLKNYLTDIKFKGSVNLYQGAIIDGIYTIFKLITGIIYSSVWFITLAIYHLFLGFLRIYLIICSRKEKNLAENLLFEYNCYKKTAWFLFLLNLPMSGMIILMVCANSGFTYPGYVIYLSALYTFYKAIMAVFNLIKYKKIGSPILSSAKIINFIAAMMSVLGLQTAMISAFSKPLLNWPAYFSLIYARLFSACVIATFLLLIILAVTSPPTIRNRQAITIVIILNTDFLIAVLSVKYI